jgi:hypothetical protein
MTDFTIVIQGPLDKISIDKIDHYLKFGNVVISHWEQDDEELKNYLHETINSIKSDRKIKVVSSTDVPPRRPDYRLHQLYTTGVGFIQSETKYSIKMRSDEYWGDISLFVDRFLLDDDKLLTSSVFWKGDDKDSNYHVSDHLMVCKTNRFVEGIEILFENINSDKINPTRIACETMFGMAFLFSKYQTDDVKQLPSSKNAFLSDFCMFDVNDFDEYLIKWNGGPDKLKKLIFEKPNGELYDYKSHR